jgi:hypothetical protein
MALQGHFFRSNRAGSDECQIIRTIVYMLDIMPYFLLKLRAKIVSRTQLLVSEMNISSTQRDAPSIIFSRVASSAAQKADLSCNQDTFKTN